MQDGDKYGTMVTLAALTRVSSGGREQRAGEKVLQSGSYHGIFYLSLSFEIESHVARAALKFFI